MLILNMGWTCKECSKSIGCPLVTDSSAFLGTLGFCLSFVPSLWKRALVSCATSQIFFISYRFFWVAEPCFPAAPFWATNHAHTGRWLWPVSCLLLPCLCLWKKDNLTSCNNSPFSSAIVTHPWTQVLPTWRLWDHSMPLSGIFNHSQEWDACLVPQNHMLILSCTTLPWSSHCICLFLFCGQGVWPIHLCVSVTQIGHDKH